MKRNKAGWDGFKGALVYLRLKFDLCQNIYIKLTFIYIFSQLNFFSFFNFMQFVRLKKIKINKSDFRIHLIFNETLVMIEICYSL